MFTIPSGNMLPRMSHSILEADTSMPFLSKRLPTSNFKMLNSFHHRLVRTSLLYKMLLEKSSLVAYSLLLTFVLALVSHSTMVLTSQVSVSPTYHYCSLSSPFSAYKLKSLPLRRLLPQEKWVELSKKVWVPSG